MLLADTFSSILGIFFFLNTNVLVLKELMFVHFWNADLKKLWWTKVWLCTGRLMDALKVFEAALDLLQHH